MKNKITQTIDGYTIITGIEGAGGLIDQEKTRPLAMAKLKLTDEYKAVESKKSEITPYVLASYAALQNARASTSIAEKNKYNAEYQATLESIKAIEKELAPLAVAMNAKIKELMNSEAVYFTPPAGETVITDEEAETITTALQSAATAGKLLADDMSQVSDYRGAVVWSDASGTWSSRTITKLGDEPGTEEILSSALTTDQQTEISEQAETARVKALTATEKADELASALAALATEAANKKASLEITGTSTAAALKEAQAWYNEQAAIIEAKYA